MCIHTREVLELLMQNYVKRKMSYFDYLHVEVHFQFTHVLYKYIYIYIYVCTFYKVKAHNIVYINVRTYVSKMQIITFDTSVSRKRIYVVVEALLVTGG
jgi:hypothetical protein